MDITSCTTTPSTIPSAATATTDDDHFYGEWIG
jgi:hypothetical protein